jgi:hypothetical protein
MVNPSEERYSIGKSFSGFLFFSLYLLMYPVWLNSSRMAASSDSFAARASESNTESRYCNSSWLWAINSWSFFSAVSCFRYSL